jgi:hypothetical protein
LENYNDYKYIERRKREHVFFCIARLMAETPIAKDRLTREKHTNQFNKSLT